MKVKKVIRKYDFIKNYGGVKVNKLEKNYEDVKTYDK